MHVLSVNSTNTANPVSVLDCYLSQDSYILRDDVSNIQPSITGNTSSTSNGLYVAYNRDLSTGDVNDRILYRDEIITLCFISSIVAFQGNGYEKDMPKVCSFFSLHKNVFMTQDRLLGNFAATSTLNSNNLTVYAAESTNFYSVEPWLFLTVLNQQQGLSTFSPKWLGISYKNSMTNADMAQIEYLKDVMIYDLYSTGHTAPLNDTQWVPNPGANDIVKIMGGFDSESYIIASFCRKYATGDVNRDEELEAGEKTFCFVAGEAVTLNRANSSHTGVVCLNFTLGELYSATFRDPLKNNNNGIINYTEPTNHVTVIQYAGRVVVALTVIIWAMVI
jgi:hypothetical protein